MMEAEGKGAVVASLGVAGGPIAYTAYCALGSYIEKNPEIIQDLPTQSIRDNCGYSSIHPKKSQSPSSHSSRHRPRTFGNGCGSV